MFGRLGPMELLIIFLIVILLFGGKKIPEIAKGLGKGIRDFKSSMAGEDEAKADAKPLANPDIQAREANPKPRRAPAPRRVPPSSPAPPPLASETTFWDHITELRSPLIRIMIG